MKGFYLLKGRLFRLNNRSFVKKSFEKSIGKVEYVGETQTEVADDSTTMRNRTLQTGAIRETDKKVRGLTIRFGDFSVICMRT